MESQASLQTLRICTKCGSTKPLEEYPKHSQSHQGRRRQCRSCHASVQKKYEQKPEYEEKRRKQQGWQRRIIRQSNIRRSRKHLTIQQLDDLFIKQNGCCYFSGVPLYIEEGVSIETYPQKISLDRLDSSRGYEPDNIVLTCMFVNIGRRQMTEEQTFKFIETLKNS